MPPPFTILNTTTTLNELRQAAQRSPASAEAHYVLGLALSQRAEVPAALECLRRAVALEPDTVAHQVALGEALCKVSAIEEAERCFTRALALDPACGRAWGWLAHLYTDLLDRPAQARAASAGAMRANPANYPAYIAWCRASIHGEPAAAALSRLSASLPAGGRPDLLRFGLARALMELGRYPDARDLLDRESPRDPRDPKLIALLGTVESALGDRDSARARFQQVLADLDDDIVGDEFVHHAWRTGDYDAVKRTLLGDLIGPGGVSRAPALAGHAVLLCNGSMNGYGDEILWAGLAPLLRAMGARIMLECRMPVRRLLETVPGVDGVVSRFDESPPEYERCSMFRVLASTDWAWEGIGTQVPFLRVPLAMTRAWRARIEQCGTGVHVGVEWRAGVSWDRDPYTKRGMPAGALRPLLDLPGVVWHSLHVGARGRRELDEQAPPLPLHPLGDAIGDFMDTAAAISALDAVVTVDTSIAHVAGGLGTPVFLLLPAYGDWRWGDAATPARWYPSLQRFSQSSPGEWRSAVDAVKEALDASCVRGGVRHRHAG